MPGCVKIRLLFLLPATVAWQLLMELNQQCSVGAGERVVERRWGASALVYFLAGKNFRWAGE